MTLFSTKMKIISKIPLQIAVVAYRQNLGLKKSTTNWNYYYKLRHNSQHTKAIQPNKQAVANTRNSEIRQENINYQHYLKKKITHTMHLIQQQMTTAIET